MEHTIEEAAVQTSAEARTAGVTHSAPEVRPMPDASPRSFDLGDLDTRAKCNVPFEFEITHPVTGEKMGVFWTVLGKDADAYASRVRAMADEQMSGQADSLDILEKKNVNALVAASVGFRSVDHGPGKVLMFGEVLAFNEKNVRDILTKIKPIREQVQKQVNNLGNWLTA